GSYPKEKHVDCGGGLDAVGDKISRWVDRNAPSGRSAPSKGWTVEITGGLADKLRGCVVDDPTSPVSRGLRIENHAAAPLGLFPPKDVFPPSKAGIDTSTNDYDYAMIDDPLFLAQRWFAYVALGSDIVAGARGFEIRVTSETVTWDGEQFSYG